MLNDSQIQNVGRALGLINTYKMKNLPEEMVAAWLRREDVVMSMSGEPTWRSLIQALRKVGQEETASAIEAAEIEKAESNKAVDTSIGLDTTLGKLNQCRPEYYKSNS